MGSSGNAMKLDANAFAHLPHLKDRIQDPHSSRFRNLDYEEMDRHNRANGHPEVWRRTDEEREKTRYDFLDVHGGGDLWVFAYGSLMWDPAFYFQEARLAKSAEYQRRFCLRTEMGRGSLAQPGLMAALDKGGECEGLAFRVHASAVDRETNIIWRREMIAWGYKPTMLPLETAQGSVDALAFVIDENSDRYEDDLSFDAVAKTVARGIGFLGTNIEYLDNLAAQLKLLDLEDEQFFALHERARAYL